MTIAEPLDEARRLLSTAEERGILIRTIGGVAVRMTCPSAQRPPLARAYKDLDFATVTAHRAALTPLLLDAGYQEDAHFNALHGKTRMFFWDPDHERQLDVFIDGVSMCHELALQEDRLRLAPDTVTVSDLLLLKLQVFETNDRDYKDALAILLDHPPGEGGIDVDYIAGLLASDWGWWRTATMVLERVDRYARELEGFDRSGVVHERVQRLLAAIEERPKSRRWKLRARVGERARWYELPEETVPP
jgi:hypothetical protein